MSPLDPPKLRDDCFAMPAGADWAPVAEALAVLRARLVAVTGVERVGVADAMGRVLAQDIRANRAHPASANSAVDGYGFAHASMTDGVNRLPLVAGRAAAGAPYAHVVSAGAAVRILTGAAIPEGVDTVILQEDVTASDHEIAFHGGLKRGANLRAMGEDAQAQDAILAQGQRLSAGDIALAAITGHAELPVRRRLRVGVMSTGDELRQPGQAARPDQVYDTNRPMLLAQIGAWGYETVDLGHLPDDRARLEAAFEEATRDLDVIFTSGAASAGDEDHVSALLNDRGAMALWRVAMKPGRPLALGMWDGVPVVGLPGNPVAALVCLLVFGRVALAELAGENYTAPQGYVLPAAFAKSKKHGRSEYLRARVRDGQAEVFPSEGSGRVSGLSWAEGLVILPHEAATIAPGDPVRFVPFSAFAG